MPPPRDLLIAAVCAVISVVGSYGAHWHDPSAHPLDVPGAMLLVVAALSLAVRRSYPVTTLLIAYFGILGYRLGGYPEGPMWIILIVAFFTVVTQGPRWVAWVIMVVGYGTLVWLPPVVNGEPMPSIGAGVGVAAWLLVLLTISEVARVRRERVREGQQRRDAEALARVTEERLRIARELHDVLAHNIAVINVQAGVALHLLDDHPEQGRAALNTIKAASKDTMTELRSILGILRSVDESAPRSPSSRMADLEGLVERTRSAGLEVRVRTDGTPGELPASVDLAGYRIVQESLTNVARHANATAATVRVTYRPHDLLIEVEDDGTGTGTSGGTGNGIAGMQERARALGGDVEAGPKDGGGFRVRARLPRQPGSSDQPNTPEQVVTP